MIRSTLSIPGRIFRVSCHDNGFRGFVAVLLVVVAALATLVGFVHLVQTGSAWSIFLAGMMAGAILVAAIRYALGGEKS